MRHVSPVERNYAWFIPFLNEREQVHAGMAKIDMHEIGAMPLQQRIQRLILAPINNGRTPLHEFQPAVHQKVRAPLWNNFDIGEWKSFGILDLLGHHEGVDAAQRL